MHLVFPDQMNCVTIMQLVAAGEDNEKDKYNLEPVTSVPKTVLLMNLLHHSVMCTTLEEVGNRISVNLELALFCLKHMTLN